MARDSRPEDVEVLAGCLREANRLEIMAGCGLEPLKVLTMSYQKSGMKLTVLYAGKVVSMGGLVEINQNRAIVWMLSAADFAQSRLSFCRITREVIRIFLDQYTVLENWFDARHTDTVDWLRWLGAEIEPEQPFGVAGLPFHHFIFKR